MQFFLDAFGDVFSFVLDIPIFGVGTIGQISVTLITIFSVFRFIIFPLLGTHTNFSISSIIGKGK